MYTSSTARCGFTLIEMSIVLVIIGLIVGGVLVGQDLIRAAGVRAQITQIEKFNTAANTFYGKYGYLPGDIPAAPAAQFGFAARGTHGGQGDGNGELEGNPTNASYGYSGIVQSDGETAMFWVDLSQAGLIQQTFNTATCCGTDGNANITGMGLNAYLPQAAIGGSNYVVVAGGSGGNYGYMNFAMAGPNYFLVEAVSVLGDGFVGSVTSSPGLTVAQAYQIDTKIDDGFPMSGNVLTLWLSQQLTYTDYQGPPSYPALQDGGHPTYCYGNNFIAGVPYHYLVSTYPNNVNCTLAFKFQ